MMLKNLIYVDKNNITMVKSSIIEFILEKTSICKNFYCLTSKKLEKYRIKIENVEQQIYSTKKFILQHISAIYEKYK